MGMADCLHYTQSVLFGLIVSFLLAKLFSFLFSSPPASINPKKKHISGGEKELLTNQHHDQIAPATGTDSDEDWEGVETTELDDAFAAATVFLAAHRSSEKLSNKLRLHLYGLYKIATEDTCSAPQPSAIKITARAKWNAWHKLGAMSPEEAMHKYIEIVTELYPNWAECSTSVRISVNPKSGKIDEFGDDSKWKRRGGDDDEKSCKNTRPMGTDLSCSMHKEESPNECKVDAIDDFAAGEGDAADNMLKCIKDDANDAADRNYPFIQSSIESNPRYPH